jgi:hypothetical protein
MDRCVEISCETQQGGEEKNCPLDELKFVEHF